MPSAELLEKHLQNIAFYAFNNEEGVLWEAHSPGGILPLYIAIGGVAYLGDQMGWFEGNPFFGKNETPKYEKWDTESMPEESEMPEEHEE